MADRVGTLADALSTAASNRQVRLSAGANWLSASARDREFALVGADVDSPRRPPAKPQKRAAEFAKMRHQLAVAGA
jgi:hypothetical protein